ncbi:hypothetical protein [Xenorhabdus doucetiae]|uniref:hypothetical protein n=1 Tax=Xenorhabdus doucetiae TaxID=351671 RepID=UPI002B40F8E0|nr:MULTISPECIES: hypothetical protein [unclassified Xenorhabdus]
MKNNKESLYLQELACPQALVSNLRDKLEDDFPKITHGILSRIWPLASFLPQPSCSFIPPTGNIRAPLTSRPTRRFLPRLNHLCQAKE